MSGVRPWGTNTGIRIHSLAPGGGIVVSQAISVARDGGVSARIGYPLIIESTRNNPTYQRLLEESRGRGLTRPTRLSCSQHSLRGWRR